MLNSRGRFLRRVVKGGHLLIPLLINTDAERLFPVATIFPDYAEKHHSSSRISAGHGNRQKWTVFLYRGRWLSTTIAARRVEQSIEKGSMNSDGSSNSRSSIRTAKDGPANAAVTGTIGSIRKSVLAMPQNASLHCRPNFGRLRDGRACSPELLGQSIAKSAEL
jgi:hypothetical protein